MSFENLEEIKDEFDLQMDKDSEVKRFLREKLKEVHPDVGGDGEEVKKVTSALAFLDKKSNTSNALTKKNETTTLAKVITNLAKSSNNSEHELDQRINQNIEEVKSKGLLPKVTLTSVSSLLTALWLFPSTISEHPILSEFIDLADPFWSYVWLILILYTAIFWIIIKVKTDREIKMKKSLKLESTQVRIFKNFINQLRRENDNNSEIVFSKNDLLAFISNIKDKKNLLDIFTFDYRKELDPQLVQSLSNKLIDRAIGKGILSSVNKQKSLEDYYQVDL